MQSRGAEAARAVLKAAVLASLWATASCAFLEFGPKDVPETAPAPAEQPAAPVETPRFPAPVARPAPPPSAAEPKSGVQPEIREAGVHRVRPGETLYAIADQYGVDAYDLANANGLLPPFDVREGQKLVLPGKATGVPAARPETRLAEGQPEPRPAERAGRETASGSEVARATEVPKAPPPLPEPGDEAGGFVWPVDGPILSEFGAKGGGLFNDGINIAVPAGTPVRAAESGVVAYAGNELRGFGNVLLIKHAGGWVTAYAHNSALLVSRGDRVRRGQVIAKSGSTGGVGQPQVHFELRKGKTAVDPLAHLPRSNASARRDREAG